MKQKKRLMKQPEAKEKIAELVVKYEREKSAGKTRTYSEEDTKKGFIVPMFQALGWNFEDRGEVSSEEHVQTSGFIDYGFYLNGRAKFFLEAKKLSANIYQENYADQAIRYSFNRVVTWAVLTDFETIKVFNAQAISKHLGDKQYFSLNYDEYLDKFDKLWLLSKAAFEEDLIDKQAEADGKKLQKVSVTDTLFADLNESRRLLTKSLHQWNPDESREDLDEGVQKLLDRLVFLRVAEDRKIEEPILRQLIRDWGNRKDNKSTIYQSMTAKFRKLDDVYNSNLFAPHPFEKWEEHDDTTEKVIDILYGKPGYYDYDFRYIPADTLGTVYENYLGYQLTLSDKGVVGSEDARKRKEQGIYYTPSYIVDYIVTNALKPVLDRCESVQDIKNIKVLDPACGSGSFLIRAMEMIFKKYKELKTPGADFLIKDMILRENIFGVDLDEKAVEIAQLNLLINTLDSRVKLPPLDKNIKNGNSLISGSDEELEKYFGKDYRNKKPFNWEKGFPQVFNRPNPGFDVIIGNPPWGVDFDKEDQTYLRRHYTVGGRSTDSYTNFIEAGLNIVKTGGHLSFITPDTFLRKQNHKATRELLLTSCSVKELIETGPVFTSVRDTWCAVFLVQKKPPTESFEIFHKKLSRFIVSADERLDHFGQQAWDIQTEVPQEIWVQNRDKIIGYLASVEAQKIIKKIEQQPNLKALDQYLISRGEEGSKFSLKPSKIKDFFMVIPADIERYHYSNGLPVDIENLSLSKVSDYYRHPKIWVIRIQKMRWKQRIVCSLDERKNSGAMKTLQVIVSRDDDIDSLKFLIGILSSSLINFWCTNYLADDMNKQYLEQIPIAQINEYNYRKVIEKVDKMMLLQRHFHIESENSNKWHSIKSEIEKTDHQIDQLVYKLYSLTPEEIKIVEESTQK